LEEIEVAFEKLEKPLSNNTELHDFLDENFSPAGGELSEVPKNELETDPQFLDGIDDTVIREFTGKVIDIWPDLTRSYSGSGSDCDDCPHSFLPVNRTFVVAGGRFREPYYWDSFWIIEGLLRTGGAFTKISRNIIENFLDFVQDFGFVPNGARVYYLNRSQPPLLSQMVRIYVEYTNDTSILDRALPLLIKEHEFWTNNRSVEVTAHGKTYTLNQYVLTIARDSWLQCVFLTCLGTTSKTPSPGRNLSAKTTLPPPIHLIPREKAPSSLKSRSSPTPKLP